MSLKKTSKLLSNGNDDNFDYVNADLAIQAEMFSGDKLEPLGNLGFWPTILVKAYNRATVLRCKSRKELETLLLSCKSDVTGHWLAVRELCMDIDLTKDAGLTLKEYIQLYLDFKFQGKQERAS